jgi:ABC-type glycerol-3-phosphate transport system substrate-binding protein
MNSPTNSMTELSMASSKWSQRTVSRRTLLRAGGALGVAAAAVPLLQACSSSSNSGSQSGTYSMWALSSTSAMMQYFAKKYQSVNKDFKLNITEVPSGSSHRAKIITSAGSGNLPDLLDDSMNYGSDFATYNLFEPLDKYFNGEDIGKKYDMYPRVWDWANTKNIPGFDGPSYTFGIPYAIAVFCPTYRVDLFQQAGHQFPNTWDELITAGQALTSAPDKYAMSVPTSGDVIDEVHPFLMQAGVQYVNADLSEAFPNREAAYTGFQFYSDIVNKYKISPAHAPDRYATDPAQRLTSGQVAITTLQTVAIDSLAKVAGPDFGPDKKLFVGQFWAGPAGRGGYYNANAVHVRKGLKNPQPLVDYMLWLLEPDQQKDMFTRFNRPPMSQAVWPQFATDPTFAVYKESLPFSQRQGGFRGWKLAELAIDRAVERVVLDGEPVKQVVDQAAKDVLAALQNA